LVSNFFMHTADLAQRNKTILGLLAICKCIQLFKPIQVFSISILHVLLQEYFPSKECFPKFKLKKAVYSLFAVTCTKRVCTYRTGNIQKKTMPPLLN